VEKTKQTYVLPFFEEWYFTTASFDLWMSKGATIHDVFAFVIIILGFN
jgi:hypothetical protein